MKVKLLKKLRKRYIFYSKPSSSGFMQYKQWVVLDLKNDREYPVGQVAINANNTNPPQDSVTIQGGIHLAIFLSGYQDRHFKNPTWKNNFNVLKNLMHG